MSTIAITATADEWEEKYEDGDTEWDLLSKGLAEVCEPDFDLLNEQEEENPSVLLETDFPEDDEIWF